MAEADAISDVPDAPNPPAEPAPAEPAEPSPEPAPADAPDAKGLRKALTSEREARRAAEEQAAQLRKDLEAAKGHGDKLKELQATLEAAQARTTARNAARIEALPDQFRDLVPEGLDPDALADWLDKASSLQPASPRPAAPPARAQGAGTPPSELTEEERAWAQEKRPDLIENGVSAATIRKFRKKFYQS